MTKEKETDAEVWKRKDDLSARQTAANVTGYVFEGKEISSEDFIKYAEDIRAWLFTNQIAVDVTTPKIRNKSEETNLPTELQLATPTLQQKKVLDYIAKQLGVEVDDNLKKEVLDWIEKTYGKKDLYPGKNETAKLFIQEKKK